MQPLLDTKLFIRTKRGPGMTQHARAILYSDHIEITGKHGDLILKADLNQLQNVKTERLLIQFTVRDQYFLLVFSSARTVAFKLMGAIGVLLGLLADPTRKTVQTWVSTMQQNGVHFQ
jgi:hypothetical protein